MAVTVHPAGRNGGGVLRRCRGMAFVYTLSIDGVAMGFCIYDPQVLHERAFWSDVLFVSLHVSHATLPGIGLRVRGFLIVGIRLCTIVEVWRSELILRN